MSASDTEERKCAVMEFQKSLELTTQLFRAPCNDISADWICTIGNT